MMLKVSTDYGSARNVCACTACQVRFYVRCSAQTSILRARRLCPVDAILTRMGAYDNMFSNASTFKVELDEWYARFVSHVDDLRLTVCSCKILRDATPRSLVILDGE